LARSSYGAPISMSVNQERIKLFEQDLRS